MAAILVGRPRPDSGPGSHPRDAGSGPVRVHPYPARPPALLLINEANRSPPMTTTLTPTTSRPEQRHTRAARPDAVPRARRACSRRRSSSTLAAALPGHGRALRREGEPAPPAARRAGRVGCRFDVASPAEVRARSSSRRHPDALVYSNPVKRRDHIVESAGLGVRLFVVDSLAETTRSPRRPRQPGAVPAGHVRRAARTGRCRASTLLDHESHRDPVAGTSSGSMPQGLLPRWFAAARSRGLGCSPSLPRRACSRWRASVARPRLLDLGGGLSGVYDEGCPPIAAYGEGH